MVMTMTGAWPESHALQRGLGPIMMFCNRGLAHEGDDEGHNIDDDAADHDNDHADDDDDDEP